MHPSTHPQACGPADIADIQFCHAFNDIPLMMEGGIIAQTDDLLAQEIEPGGIYAHLPLPDAGYAQRLTGRVAGHVGDKGLDDKNALLTETPRHVPEAPQLLVLGEQGVKGIEHHVDQRELALHGHVRQVTDCHGDTIASGKCTSTSSFIQCQVQLGALLGHVHLPMMAPTEENVGQRAEHTLADGGRDEPQGGDQAIVDPPDAMGYTRRSVQTELARARRAATGKGEGGLS